VGRPLASRSSRRLDWKSHRHGVREEDIGRLKTARRPPPFCAPTRIRPASVRAQIQKKGVTFKKAGQKSFF